MSGPTEEQLAGVGAWIRTRAASNSLDETLAWVTERQDRLIAAVEKLTAGELTSAPAPGEWSPIEAFKHVVEWNWQVGEDILHVCLTGERPGNPLPSFEPDRATLIKRQRESLESLWAHVSAADPGAFLEATWEHPFFGTFNWREWFLFLGVHCTDHANQIVAAGEKR